MSKKGLGKSLGKGLEALLGDVNLDQSSNKEIDISSIEANPDQPRREFDQESLEELAASISIHGILQPILVRPVGDKYHIIAGERRYRAAKIAGLEKVNCIIQDCTDLEMAERALVENIQRSNLSPVEEGRAYLRLINEYGLTQEEIAKQVGKGRTTVTNLLRIINLPESVIRLLQGGQITLGHAKLLLGLDDPSVQVLISQKIERDRLSVRETEELLQRINTDREEKLSQKKKTKPIVTEMRSIEEKLRENFQTKVHLKGDGSKGKIEINYYSEEELNRLLELWQIEI